jgi:drug/metabolite transporter (DMT)-like permease
MIIGQWFFISALTMTKQTGVLNMMTFWTIILSYFVSILRYHEMPNIFTSLGVVLVFLGVWKTVFNK